MVFSVFSVMAGSAQSKGYVGTFEFRTGGELGNNKEFSIVDGTLTAGYSFNKTLALSVVMDLATGLFDYGDTRNYELNTTLGALMGINLYSGKYDGWELTLSSGSSLGGSDWGYLYGDAGIRWHNYPLSKNNWHTYFALGTRYYNSYYSRFDNRWIMYVGIGFKFRGVRK